MKATTKQPFITRTGTDAINRVPFLLLSFMLVLGLALAACEGPAGSQGERGPQGEAGPIGPAGEDGSVMHAGEGAPTDDLGKIGDFYLDTNAAAMYGPKTQDGWGVPFSLQGSPGEDGEDGADGTDGQDGEDGSQIFAGTSPPEGSLGKPGDYYLNKSTFDLYGPKTDSGWGTPINLQATTNVMYSAWFDIVWNGEDHSTDKQMYIPESRITEEFLNSGTMQMYLKTEIPDGVFISGLPILRRNDNLYFLAANTNVPIPDFIGIVLFHTSVDRRTSLSIDYTASRFQVRYVLIPGSQEIGSEAPGGSLPIDLEDYDQVKKYFRIKE